jgi:hydroxypyruvate reductase
MTGLHDLARRLAAQAIAAVDPERLVRDELQRRMAQEARFEAVLAVGKAAAGLARGTRSIFAHSPRRLLIRAHSSPALLDPGWEQMSGGHPFPDRQSLAAGVRLHAWLAKIDPAQALLALISGGGSACIELPAAGLTLEDIAATQRALFRFGLPIDRINCVRKHLSALKGGGALVSTSGRVLALLLSDVPGDDPSTIASGLFAVDSTTYDDALATVRSLRDLAVPQTVRRHLEMGARGEIPETVKPGDPALERVENKVIGNAWTAVAAVAGEARRQGLRTEEGSLAGEAAAAGRELVARGRALAGERVALVLGGETTVALSQGGTGRGGRNGELALAAAGELRNGEREVVLALATDGEDGTTRTAGALVDGGAWAAMLRSGVDPAAALASHDSLSALTAVPEALLHTGTTGTNVGDLAIYLRG